MTFTEIINDFAGHYNFTHHRSWDVISKELEDRTVEKGEIFSINAMQEALNCNSEMH